MKNNIEHKFFYKGFNAIIKAYPMGHRCGYVEIPENHKLFKKDYSEINDIYVHGRITFSDELEGCNGWFIGFDCSHYKDGKDFTIMDEKYRKFYTEMEEKYPDTYEKTIWTKEMVEDELKQLIDQL